MMLALSKFKVANGLEHDVALAFLNRPRQVEQAEGFLGLEVFTDGGDPSIFYLFTRWATDSAFRQWHASEARHAAHHLMPKGLKLDAAFTQLVVMERVCD